MNVTISIPDDVATKLHERAAASGQAVPAYASQLVEQAVKSPTLEELLAPVQADFARSGMTGNQFVDLGRDLLDKVRAANKDGASMPIGAGDDAGGMLQWAALPPETGRQHATVRALTSGKIRLAC